MLQEKLASRGLMMLCWLAPSLLLAIIQWPHPNSNVTARMAYDRTAILQGELWRLWTAHFVHFNAGHLSANVLAGFVLIINLNQAATAKHQAVMLLCTAPMISLFLLSTTPDMTIYAGFSGLASELLVWVILQRLTQSRTDHAAWVMLLLFTTKLIWERFSGTGMFVKFEGGQYKVEPMAHLGGALAMVVLLANDSLLRYFGVIRPKRAQDLNQARRL